MTKFDRSHTRVCLDALEPRTLLSTYLYQNVADLVGPVTPTILADGYRGPAAIVGDLDHDNIPDVLVGNAGVNTSGANPVDYTGAALLSGATGQLIRAHTRPDARFGWYVSALGDVNFDAIPDYAIGSGIDGASKAFVFSGADGSLLLTLAGNSPTGGATVAGPGDLDHDGYADILVGFVGENRAVLFSGYTGAVLRQYAGDSGQEVSHLGIGVGGGTDFNTDGTNDFIVAGHQGTHAGSLNDPFNVIIYVYSGATGASLATLNGFQNLQNASLFIPPIIFDTSADFNADGVNDILYGTGNSVLVLDEAAGGHAIDLAASTDDGSLQSAVAIGDVNADGIPDVAVGSPTLNLNGARVGGVAVFSGASGQSLGVLSDSRFASANSRLGSSLAFGADFNHDGLPDLLAVGDQNPLGHPTGSGRVFLFSGDRLVPPTPTGFTTDSAGNVLAWGSVRDHGFLIRNNSFTLVSSLAGFQPTDSIIAIAPTQDGGAYILGAAHPDGSGPFIWRSGAPATFNNGTRTDIAGFTEVGNPGGTYTTLLGVDINTTGNVAIHRLRQGFGATSWLWDRAANTLTFLFDGSPRAINNAGHVLGIDPAGTSTILWTPAGATTVDGLRPSGFNDDDFLVGSAQRQGDTAIRPYIWHNGAFTQIPLIDGGQDFVPTAINNNGVVVGTYRNSDTFTISMFVYTPADNTTRDLKDQVDAAAPVSFTNASNFVVLGIGNPGTIMGRVPGDSSFILIPDSDDGPFTVGNTSLISSAALPDGGIFVSTTNPVGEIIGFIKSPLNGPWHRFDLSQITGAPRITGDTVTWYDPQEGVIHIAAGSASGLLLLTRLASGTWTLRNLTTEIPGSEAIVDSLIALQPQNGMTLVGGLTAAHDLVIYGQTLQTNAQGQVLWAYDNLFNSVIRANHLPVPSFDTATRGRIISYETSWDGLNIVGADANGQPVAIWTAPGVTGWRLTNLSDATTNPDGHAGFHHLTAYITSWGGINIASGDDLKVLWWVPGFEGEWQVASLRSVANGPRLRGETLDAYFTPWGGLNVAGLDDSNRLWIYWWTPSIDQWFTSPISDSLPAGSPVPVGNLSTLATPAGSLNVFARTQAGDLLHYFWQAGGADHWTVTDVTLTAQA